jgi:hypothetical protein
MMRTKFLYNEKKLSVDVNPVVPEEKNQYETGTSISFNKEFNCIQYTYCIDTENLCYFYATFNALPTIFQKYAFCAK